MTITFDDEVARRYARVRDTAFTTHDMVCRNVASDAGWLAGYCGANDPDRISGVPALYHDTYAMARRDGRKQRERDAQMDW
jgi:hypothetical protein